MSAILQKTIVKRRIWALARLAGLGGIFVFFYLGTKDIINMNLMFGPCGFRQDYGLPCPTCGMITSAMAFASGRFITAFYTQPAGFVLNMAFAVIAVLSVFTAVTGKEFVVVRKFIEQLKIGWLVVAVLVIVVAGWAVLLARALTSQ